MPAPELEKDLMVTASVMAQWLNMTTRRLQQGVKEGWVPKASRGKYPLIQGMYARIEYLEKQLGGDNSGNLYSEKVKLAQLDVSRKELEFAREQGLLVDVRSAAFLWNQVCLNMKQKLQAVPVKAAPRVLNLKTVREIRELMKSLLKDVCDELRNIEPADYLDADGSVFQPQTGAGSNGSAVGGRKKKTKPRGKQRTRPVAH